MTKDIGSLIITEIGDVEAEENKQMKPGFPDHITMRSRPEGQPIKA